MCAQYSLPQFALVQTEYDRIISAAAEVQLAMMQSSHDLPGLLLSVTNPLKKID